LIACLDGGYGVGCYNIDPELMLAALTLKIQRDRLHSGVVCWAISAGDMSWPR
jgi:hypothetical protein